VGISGALVELFWDSDILFVVLIAAWFKVIGH